MQYIYTWASLPWWLSGKESACQAGDSGLIPGLGRSPWRNKWQPTPVFLLEKSHGQRSLVGYSPWGHKRQSNWTAAASTHLSPPSVGSSSWVVDRSPLLPRVRQAGFSAAFNYSLSHLLVALLFCCLFPCQGGSERKWTSLKLLRFCPSVLSLIFAGGVLFFFFAGF